MKFKFKQLFCKHSFELKYPEDMKDFSVEYYESFNLQKDKAKRICSKCGIIKRK